MRGRCFPDHPDQNYLDQNHLDQINIVLIIFDEHVRCQTGAGARESCQSLWSLMVAAREIDCGF